MKAPKRNTGYHRFILAIQGFDSKTFDWVLGRGGGIASDMVPRKVLDYNPCEHLEWLLEHIEQKAPKIMRKLEFKYSTSKSQAWS